ncbi:MAG: transcription factor S [Candidatus Methanomethylicaceae archaeon]
MEFCPNCNSILLVDRKRKILLCRKCGYEKDGGCEGQRFVESINSPKETVIVKSSEGRVLPITRSECRRCGNLEAYYWMMQTRRADEAPTRFYRCTKCGHTWREYE